MHVESQYELAELGIYGYRFPEGALHTWMGPIWPLGDDFTQL